MGNDRKCGTIAGSGWTIADGNSWFERGIALSTGNGALDLIEAHKCFNLAAMMGVEEAVHLRAEIAEELSAQDIARAQRAARAFLGSTRLPDRFAA